ncbi:DNA-3-methyladenine glycosylase-like [Lissotriton helveticus]
MAAPLSACQKLTARRGRCAARTETAPVAFTEPGKKSHVPASNTVCLSTQNRDTVSPPVPRPVIKTSRLGPEFFDRPCVDLARALLGQVLTRRLPGGDELRGRIVETEAYLGGDDKASHSAGGRRTGRNVAMFMAPGTMYVYQIYGMYYCLNVSSQGDGAAVLLRALEPLQGLDYMREARAARRKKEACKPIRDWELCNGPSKICQALALDKSFDRRDLTSDPDAWVESDQDPQAAIVSAPRIGIGSSAGEWATKALRFYLLGNRSVSVRNKSAEQESS